MGCCGEIWLLDKDGVAQRWEKEKLGIANFWKLPTFLFFQENMVSILGDSKHVLHAIAWSINVFPRGNAFSHIQEFSTGVSVVYVSLFLTPVENSVGAEAKFLDICLESPRNIFFWKSGPEASCSPLWYKGSWGRTCGRTCAQGSFLVELVCQNVFKRVCGWIPDVKLGLEFGFE